MDDKNDNNDVKPSEPPRNEGDAKFDVTTLDEVKDENGNGIFHMTTRFKWILALSILLLFAVSVLIYSAYMSIICLTILMVRIPFLSSWPVSCSACRCMEILLAIQR